MTPDSLPDPEFIQPAGVLPQARGRGTGINPANRFPGTELDIDLEQVEGDQEYLQELQRPRTRYFEDSSRTVISENDSPDIPFRYSLNPYRGCLHGCSYCYARPSHEYLGLSSGLDFETKIFVKKNAAGLFRDWLAAPKYVPALVMMSGVTDCYQPVERALKITRQCLEVALEARQPLSIITKNALITRDLDLLSEMAERNLIHVALSITSLDQSLSRVMEPACSAPYRRVEAVRQLSERNIPVHVMVSPVVPGLTDSEIPEILKATAAAGAKSASYIMLRLPMSVEQIFCNWLETKLPEHAERVLSRLRSVRSGALNSVEFGKRMRGEGPIADQIGSLFQVARRKVKLDSSLAPLSTSDFRPPRTKTGQMHLF
jgi:DNA repair photolyase